MFVASRCLGSYARFGALTVRSVCLTCKGLGSISSEGELTLEWMVPQPGKSHRRQTGDDTKRSYQSWIVQSDRLIVQCRLTSHCPMPSDIPTTARVVLWNVNTVVYRAQWLPSHQTADSTSCAILVLSLHLSYATAFISLILPLMLSPSCGARQLETSHNTPSSSTTPYPCAIVAMAQNLITLAPANPDLHENKFNMLWDVIALSFVITFLSNWSME
jgi:hypothetical protein